MVSNHSLFRYVTRPPIYGGRAFPNISGILPTGSAQPSELPNSPSAQERWNIQHLLFSLRKLEPFVLGRGFGFRCRFGCRRRSRFGFGIGDADAGSLSSALSSAPSPTFPRRSSFQKDLDDVALSVPRWYRSPWPLLRRHPAHFPRRYLRA